MFPIGKNVVVLISANIDDGTEEGKTVYPGAIGKVEAIEHDEKGNTLYVVEFETLEVESGDSQLLQGKFESNELATPYYRI